MKKIYLLLGIVVILLAIAGCNRSQITYVEKDVKTYQDEILVTEQDFGNGVESKTVEYKFPKQPEIYGKTRQENNKILFQYVYDTSYSFDVSDGLPTNIIFVTDKPITEGRGLYLALDGSSKGLINMKYRNRNLDNLENEYVFDADEIYAGGHKIDIAKYIKDGKLTIGAFVGEKGNSIYSIVIMK